MERMATGVGQGAVEEDSEKRERYDEKSDRGLSATRASNAPSGHLWGGNSAASLGLRASSVHRSSASTLGVPDQ